MKKKAKLAFAQLQEELQVISQHDLAFYQGGDGIDGYCLFYAMSYLSNGSHNTDYYLNSYGQVYGYSGLVPSGNDGYISGADIANVSSFVAGHFTSSSLNPSGGIQAALASGWRVLADMSISSNTTHAIIITGYTSSGYTYYDPQNNVTGVVQSGNLAGNVLMGIH
ncbi:hypothetical protein [Chitinophaga rhizosphaerae]|uniref:hypothetical protein n=1 Tax=Chitinophaga rhizosphaerae TaxID=1864947 RepID=UPI000F800241|nr:hypothetical protein [Chitinophaga rhizosphaerae]